MRLEATLSAEELHELITKLSPVKIRLGQKGELLLGALAEVGFVPNVGLRIVCAAQLWWDLLGISVPVTLQSLVLLVAPLIENKGDAEALVFRMHIESVDLAMVPAMIADRVTEHLNKELVNRHVELPWKFTETLSHAFPLPAAVKNIASIGLRALFGSLKITNENLVFAVTFGAEVRRREEPRGTTGTAADPEVPDPSIR